MRKNGTGVTGVRLSKSSATLTNASVRVHLFETTLATYLQTLRPTMPA